MKNQPFLRRLGFAVHGLAATLAESSFRTQLVGAALVLLALLWFRPAPLWWALAALAVTLVLSAELANTALERLADRLHPEIHPEIKVAKDCMAAAVLVASLGALAVAAAFAFDLLR